MQAKSIKLGLRCSHYFETKVFLFRSVFFLADFKLGYSWKYSICRLISVNMTIADNVGTCIVGSGFGR